MNLDKNIFLLVFLTETCQRAQFPLFRLGFDCCIIVYDFCLIYFTGKSCFLIEKDFFFFFTPRIIEMEF